MGVGSTTGEIVTSVDDALERLAAFEATTFPVITLYLNTQPNTNGQPDFRQFAQKELSARARTFSAGSAERQSFELDTVRIEKYLQEELNPSTRGLAVFACAAADLFETLQLHAPFEENRLYVYNQPHLFHLTRVDDENPRYAVLVTDANSARIFVFGLGEVIDSERVQSKKVQRVKVGGWSQARYQRRVENAHLHHAQEVIDALDGIVRADQVSHIILAGDPVAIPILREALPKHLADKVVDTIRLDVKAPEKEIFEATLKRLREEDAKTEYEKVERLFGAYREGGLAAVGREETLQALANGQVDELLISAAMEQEHPAEETVDAIIAPEIPDAAGSTETDEPRSVLLPDLLVTKAKQTGARVTFVENAVLLAGIEGVGAFLRWRS